MGPGRIDRPTTGLRRRPSARAFAALVDLVDSFGLPSVAEGIESEGMLELARVAGCRDAQGYLFARPAPAAEIDAVLAATIRR